MTIDESINILEDGDWWEELGEWYIDVNIEYDRLHESVDMAIEALKEKKKAEKNEPLTKEELRPHGKWIGIGYEGYADGNPVYDYWECSECGNEEDGEDVPEQNPYCRSCGAKMDK